MIINGNLTFLCYKIYMKRFLFFFAYLLLLCPFGLPAIAQDANEPDKPNTLASMFETWNERQKESLKKAAGVENIGTADEEATGFYKPPPVTARKAQGARSRIFDPVTSYIEQRRAYQDRNLDNLDRINQGRNEHQANMSDALLNINDERQKHLEVTLRQNQIVLSEREQHLEEHLDTKSDMQSRQETYLKKYVANHRKYLELDVEN